MKTLNLVNPEKSDIKYEIQKFPDGQQNIVITFIEQFGEDNHFKPVLIKSRLNNWLDLELITCAVASLRELGVEEIHLYVPYIIGARSDRKFVDGGNNYLRDVICPVINSLGFKTVTCIDPHSDVLEACIKGFKAIKQHQSWMSIGNMTLLEKSLSLIYFNNDYSDVSIKNKLDNFILVSPDAGASHKIYKLAEKIGYTGDIITCSKDRDAEGNITKTVVPLKLKDIEKDVIIIDDICDGGATFINIAKELQEHEGFEGKIYLIVTHGIFSKGLTKLSEYFDGIYCTNSYKDLVGRDIEKYSVGNKKDFVNPLNVF